jgi:hypothetical protein
MESSIESGNYLVQVPFALNHSGIFRRLEPSGKARKRNESSEIFGLVKPKKLGENRSEVTESKTIRFFTPTDWT